MIKEYSEFIGHIMFESMFIASFGGGPMAPGDPSSPPLDIVVSDYFPTQFYKRKIGRTI